MASPFSIFRKHQKWLMAIATLLAMFAFVVLGSAGGGGGARGPQTPQSTAVATWKYGDITKLEVQNRIYRRQQLNTFISALYYAVTSLPRSFNAFPTTEADVLQSIVLAKKAQLMGMSVSDQEINDFFDRLVNQFSEGHPPRDLNKTAIFNDTFKGSTTQQQLFEALRLELLANDYFTLLQSDAVNDATPLQRWDYYSRLNRKASIQTLGVEVKDFVSQVTPEPSDDALQTFFDQYKDRVASITSPDPGFRQPDRATLGIFKATKAKFVDAEKPKITDAEIAAYYDAHKEDFRHSDLDDIKPGADDKTKTTDKPKPDDKSKPGETPKTDDKPKADQKPATDEKPATPKTDTAPKPDDKPAPPPSPKSDDKAPPADKSATPAPKPDDKPAPPAPKTPDKSPPTEPPPAGKSSQSLTRHGEELLALADPAATPAAPSDAAPKSNTAPKTDTPEKKDDTGKTAPPAAPSGKTTPAATEPPTTIPPPATTAPAKTEPPATPPAIGTPAKTDTSTPPKTDTPAKTGAPAKSDSTGKPAAKPVRYDPVDSPKVRKTIITKLAEDRADKAIADAFKKLTSKVSSYASAYSAWKANPQGADQPPVPDFKALAAEAGVEYEATKSLSSEEMFTQLEFGKAIMMVRGFPSVLAIAFNPNQRDYHPEEGTSQDFETNYLWWRTDFKPAYVPEFKAVKDQVLFTWKMLKARKLALAKAQQYCDDAGKLHKTFKEAFQFLPTVTVREINSFTWLSQSTPLDMSQAGSFGRTKLSGIEYAGNEFMQKVFTLDKGAAGVAMNEPQTVAYAIQLIDLAPSETVFRQQFVAQLAIPFSDVGIQAAYADARNTLGTAIKSVEDELDFKRIATDQTAANESVPYSEDD